jgi:hypothetical protein
MAGTRLMIVPTVGLALIIGVANDSTLEGVRPGAQSSGPSRSAESHRAVLDRYCVSCHNERLKTAKLALDSADLSQVATHADIWEKVIAKLRAGMMPPAGRPRPDSNSVSAIVDFLEGELDRAADAAPSPGRTEAFHRLNRAEYHNVVRDLLAVDMDVKSVLPADDASYGFDNVAGVLKMSQSRLEQYVLAAQRISRAAVGSAPSTPAISEYRVPETTQQYDRVEGLPFGTRGGMLVRHDFPQNGEYEFQIVLMCRRGGECDGSTGFPDEHHLLVLVDGVEVRRFTLEPRRFIQFRPPEERTWRVRLPLRAGSHDVGVTFEKLPSIREIDSAYQRFIRPYYLNGIVGQPNNTIYQPYLDVVSIIGPFQASGSGQTPSRQRVFVCYPQRDAEEATCARTILRTLARRAYRRPVVDDDIEPLWSVYRQRAGAAGFEAGIEAALESLLVSFEFLYRVEQDPAGVPPSSSYAISDLELASRLSFFLWSSIPDDTLLTLAEKKQLHTPSVLEQQVNRMLKDSRSDAFTENFTGQWLMLRNLDAVRPDLPLFPNFDDTLRRSERRETELFFGSVLRERRSVVELLTADYTFVNERLARHYGIPGIFGNEFHRVSVADEHRRGLLGQASILTVTSRPNRTSPVLRGKWILENILGTPPPDPPANVPALKENQTGEHLKLGVRERMAQHRANPVCAGCHAMIDPPGFALENFDAIGQWRTTDEASNPIDALGVLPDATKFDGLIDFRAKLLRNREVFATTVTRKLLIYALGRGLEAYDMPAVRRIIRDARPGQLRLSDLVLGITKSVPFQMRRARGDVQVADAQGQ